MNEIASDAGWDCSYRQIRPGHLVARTTLVQIGQSFLLREQVSHCVECRGAPAPDHLSILYLHRNRGTRIAGANPGTADSWLIPPGYDLSMVSGDAVDIYTITVPRSLLEAELHDVRSPQSTLKFTTPVPLRLTKNDEFELKACINASFLAKADCSPDKNLERILVGVLAKAVRQSTTGNGVGRERSYTRYRRLLKVLDFLKETTHRSVSVPEMAGIIDVTDRTLTRYFKEYCGLPPLQYARASRLNAARETLSNTAGSPGTITTVALEQGFEHLGRFSKEFRAHFGVLPSEYRSRKSRAQQCQGRR